MAEWRSPEALSVPESQSREAPRPSERQSRPSPGKRRWMKEAGKLPGPGTMDSRVGAWDRHPHRICGNACSGGRANRPRLLRRGARQATSRLAPCRLSVAARQSWAYPLDSPNQRALASPDLTGHEHVLPLEHQVKSPALLGVQVEISFINCLHRVISLLCLLGHGHCIKWSRSIKSYMLRPFMAGAHPRSVVMPSARLAGGGANRPAAVLAPPPPGGLGSGRRPGEAGLERRLQERRVVP